MSDSAINVTVAAIGRAAGKVIKFSRPGETEIIIIFVY